MSRNTVRNRIVKSFGLAAVLVASMLAGFAGTASAMPAQQGGMATNVVLTIPAAANVGGNYTETPGQAWVWVYRVSDHGMYTGTVADAVKANDISKPGSHELKPNGNRQFGGSVDPGDYLTVAHLGANTYVMSMIVSIADGNQYPNQMHVMTWAGSGTTAGTTKAKTSTTAAKPAVPLGTAMCMMGTASKPITTTGAATLLVGDAGDTFTGKLLFVRAISTTMTAENSLAAYAKDNTLGMERGFDGLAVGTKMSIGSGNWRVFRLPVSGGKPVYMGDLDAAVNGSYDKLTRIDGVCTPYDLRLAGSKAATTGVGLDILGLLALAASMIGLVLVNRRRFIPGFVRAS